MKQVTRHIARSKGRAHCGASMLDDSNQSSRMPAMPMHLRRLCARCLLAVNADRARQHGWRVRIVNHG